MSSPADMPSVFIKRCIKAGLTEAEVEKLKSKRITTLATLAYSCSWVPGTDDDSKFLAMAKRFLGDDAVDGA
eukprot:1854460-Amphidinium_carterae.1